MALFRDFFELFFPRLCCICDHPLTEGEQEICMQCLLSMSYINATSESANIVERRFIGRVPVVAAEALLVFKEQGKTQRLLHELKYYGNETLGIVMGRQIGRMVSENPRLSDVDIVVPVPLHWQKERKRGYNQSLLLCQGLTEIFPRPISDKNIRRIRPTDSQTHKNREERLENMRGVFIVDNPKAFEHKHLLLVDDVITTGATTEACWQALKEIPGIRISIVSLAVSGDT